MARPPPILLDDGDYLLRLVDGADGAGVLERRFLVSPSTPAGLADLGSFSMQENGRWCAQITAQRDHRNPWGWTPVADDAERIDAIVALWRARHDAFLAQHCL